MVACVVERAQALAIVRVAKRDAELLLELVVACADAALVEAQRKRRHHLTSLDQRKLRGRCDAEEFRRECDLFARRGRLVVNDVENAVGAPRKGSVDRLRDVEDMDAVRYMPGLGDAVHRAAQEPGHAVLPGTVDSAEPKDRDRDAAARAEVLPSQLRIDAGTATASESRHDLGSFVDPGTAAVG